MQTKLLIRAVIGVLIVSIVVIYINYYNSYKQDYNITQSYLDSIDLSLVYEKYPIVIYDKVCQPQKLLTTLFAYSYMFSKQLVIQPGTPIYNHSKHLILWSNASDLIVNLINPKYKDTIQWSKRDPLKTSTFPLEKLDKDIQYVTLKLKQDQVLILPAFWIFDSNKTINAIFLDDLLSIVF